MAPRAVARVSLAHSDRPAGRSRCVLRNWDAGLLVGSQGLSASGHGSAVCRPAGEGLESWSQIAAAVTPALLAEGMGASAFTPPRQAGDPEVEALTATFAYGNGIKVLHEGIQYLVERSKDEQRWLAARSNPLTVRDPAPSRRNWVLPYWSTALVNGCRPQQTCSV